MAKKARKSVPASKIAAAIKAPVALRARPIADLAPDVVDKQLALYEAAQRGDNAEFVRIRDGK